MSHEVAFRGFSVHYAARGSVIAKAVESRDAMPPIQNEVQSALAVGTLEGKSLHSMPSCCDECAPASPKHVTHFGSAGRTVATVRYDVLPAVLAGACSERVPPALVLARDRGWNHRHADTPLHEAAGCENDVEFLTELAAFLGSRWKAWLRPILVVLLVAGLLLAFANQLPRLLAAPAGDKLAPISRDDYRHDGARVNRY
jgi:Family of unknown function (DUF5989)